MPRPVEPQDLLALKTIAEVQLAPDGRRAAYTLTEVDAAADEYRSAIWVVAMTGGEPRPFTRGPARDTAPRWSPDGSQLGFLSDRDGGTPQLYVMPADGDETRKLTALERGAGPAVWSPDGTRLAFAARVATEAIPVDRDARARWAHRPRVVTRAAFKADGAGYQLDTRSHLFVVRAADDALTQVTDGAGDDRTPAWSPDGRRLVFSRTRAGAADYQVSDLWIVDAGGGSPQRLTEDVGRAQSPTWSPDGATIACYGTDEQQPGFGEPLYRVWTVPAAGGPARRLTAGWDRGAFLLPPPAVNPGPIWSPDGRALTFLAATRGTSRSSARRPRTARCGPSPRASGTSGGSARLPQRAGSPSSRAGRPSRATSTRARGTARTSGGSPTSTGSCWQISPCRGSSGAPSRAPTAAP